jgi:RNA polymerase sigma-70 factor (family 1)
MQLKPLHNEKELLLQIANSDEDAFRIIFGHYWDKIYSTAFMFTKLPELSEDMTQDVFAKIWVRREKLATVEKFESYLFIIARNLIFDRLHKEVYTVKYHRYYEEYFSDPALPPNDKIEFKELENIIEEGISKLPVQQQKAFRLSRFWGMNHDQIAVEMGISRSSVKSYIVRAILTLRKYLANTPEKA